MNLVSHNSGHRGLGAGLRKDFAREGTLSLEDNGITTSPLAARSSRDHPHRLECDATSFQLPLNISYSRCALSLREARLRGPSLRHHVPAVRDLGDDNRCHPYLPSSYFTSRRDLVDFCSGGTMSHAAFTRCLVLAYIRPPRIVSSFIAIKLDIFDVL